MLYAVFTARYSQSPVDKLVECCALLGGADGAHDGLPYDVAVQVLARKAGELKLRHTHRGNS